MKMIGILIENEMVVSCSPSKPHLWMKYGNKVVILFCMNINDLSNKVIILILANTGQPNWWCMMMSEVYSFIRSYSSVVHLFSSSSSLPPLLLFSALPPSLTSSPSLPPSVLPGVFMSQVTKGSCALERAPCSRSSKYLSAVCSPQTLSRLPWTRLVGYFTAPPRWLSSPRIVCETRKEKASRDTNGLAQSHFYSLWICQHICFVRAGCHKIYTSPEQRRASKKYFD